jgi:hypothetical protein
LDGGDLHLWRPDVVADVIECIGVKRERSIAASVPEQWLPSLKYSAIFAACFHYPRGSGVSDKCGSSARHVPFELKAQRPHENILQHRVFAGTTVDAAATCTTATIPM